jgi:hypothetical protein
MSKEWLLISRAPQTLLTTCDMYQWVRTGCWLLVPPDNNDNLQKGSMGKDWLLVTGAPRQ